MKTFVRATVKIVFLFVMLSVASRLLGMEASATLASYTAVVIVATTLIDSLIGG